MKISSNLLKTALAVVAAVMICVSLAGCGVSKDDYAALERRVAALEKETGLDSSKSSDKSSGKDTAATDKDSSGSNSSSKTKSSSRDNSDDENADFDDKDVSDSIDVKQHDYIDNDNNKFSIFTFQNNSDFDVNATIKIVTKDKNGKELEEQEKTIKGLPKDKKSYASFKLDPDTDTIVRTVSYSKFTARDNPIKNINARITKAEGGANIIVKNDGSSSIDGVEYMTLFYKSNDFVGFDNGDVPSIPANSSEIIPSEYYDKFDRAEVYFAVYDD